MKKEHERKKSDGETAEIERNDNRTSSRLRCLNTPFLRTETHRFHTQIDLIFDQDEFEAKKKSEFGGNKNVSAKKT